MGTPASRKFNTLSDLANRPTNFRARAIRCSKCCQCSQGSHNVREAAIRYRLRQKPHALCESSAQFPRLGPLWLQTYPLVLGQARRLTGFVLICEDALNRFPFRHGTSDSDSSSVRDERIKAPRIDDNSLRIMMYIFPRQFGLHNAFTSHVDHTNTAQKFQDYTLREEEISATFSKKGADATQRLDIRVPKRLRGHAEHLVQRMQIFHARCSYAKLLEHHCPVRGIFF